MLFTDADFVTIEDLAALNSEVPKVARAESIDVDQESSSTLNAVTGDSAMGICSLACQEIGQRILFTMNGFSGFQPAFAMPNNQTVAVLNLVGPSVERSRVSLSQVVVSNPFPGYWSGLRMLTAYHALCLFFRAAYHRKLNDRYQVLMDHYEDEIKKKYWPRMFRPGLFVVNKPMAAPGAVHEFNAGSWTSSNVTTVSGTNSNGTTSYDVAITWVDQSLYISQSLRGNAESEIGARVVQSVATGTVLQASIAGLNPPNGKAPINVILGQGVVTPLNASGWNVWVGNQNGPLYLQNAAPVPIATSTYTLAGAPVLSGSPWLGGQLPDAAWTMQQTLSRG